MNGGSNASKLVVYNKPMRPSLTVLLVLSILSAQATQPDLAVVFVHDADGRPMPGAYATPIAAQAWQGKPNAPAWTVEMHFTVSKDYPYSPHEIGRHQFWPLTPDTVREGRHRHLRFSILDCWCRDQHLLVIQGADTMRVDIPNDANVRGHLVHNRVARSGLLPSPEVIRFRAGRFSFEALAQDGSMHEVEQRIARTLMCDARKREAAFARKVGRIGVMSEAMMQVRERPSATSEVKLVEMRGDTAVLRVSGTVMLDGGCASNTPMMAVEVNVTHDNWLQLASTMDVQMDCGLSTIAWKDHELRIPMVEWTQRHGPHGLAVMPGRYRLGVRFADGAVRWTKAFRLE